MARVLLLFGGRSAEHEVSCVTAVAIADALRSAGHTVTPIGIGRDGSWHLADSGVSPFQADGPEVQLLIPSGTINGPGGQVEFDVVFPALHGPYGEDGTIQGALEMADSRYVGVGVLGSAIGMEKDVAKRLFRYAGIPTPDYDVVDRQEWDASPGAVVGELVQRLGLPVFAKPTSLGSSVGVAGAASDDELKQAIEDAFGYGDAVIVEEAIIGREIEVAVLEGPRVSVPGEIVIEGAWYDYESKYHDDTSQFVTPADLTDAQSAHVRELAGTAFAALKLTGLARVDFFFEEGGRGFLISEINTMPGFTPISGFPKMWEATGMSYPELCDELVQLALGAR